MEGGKLLIRGDTVQAGGAMAAAAFEGATTWEQSLRALYHPDVINLIK